MDEQDRKAEMAAINARIAAAKGLQEPTARVDEHYSQAQLAWRMVIELVAGLGIGFGIGYGLDLLFGTLPIFMVLFVMLGLAAGVKTMLRSAQEIQDKKLAELAADDTPQGADITRSSGADTTRSSGADITRSSGADITRSSGATDQPPKPGAQT